VRVQSLSTTDEVAASLVADFGVATFAIKGEDPPDLLPPHRADRGAAADGHHGRRLRPGEHPATRGSELLAGVVGGTEETTTGVTRLRAMARDGALRYP